MYEDDLLSDDDNDIYKDDGEDYAHVLEQFNSDNDNSEFEGFDDWSDPSWHCILSMTNYEWLWTSIGLVALVYAIVVYNNSVVFCCLCKIYSLKVCH